MREGKDKLAQFRENKAAGVSWSPAQQVSRRDPQGLDMETLRAVFSADMSRLPAFVGLPNFEGGFTLIRISKVMKPILPDAAARKAFGKQLQRSHQEELASYLADSGRDMTYL